MQTISFYTLGCRLNQSETAVIENTFKIDGFKIVDFKQPADISVINTCTVTENGDADTRRLVYKLNRLNPKNKNRFSRLPGSDTKRKAYPIS